MDQKGAEHLLQQAFDLWFRPEIERRKSFGNLPEGFSIYAGQVIMDFGKETPLIKLNDEVRAVVAVRTPRAIAKNEILDLNEFEKLEDMQLPNEFPNAGHLTAILHKNLWYIFFDFRYNAGRVETQLSSADQFLQTARFCVDSNLTIAAIDNLYDAVQLMAKCFLLIFPDEKVLDATSHGFIETRFNLQGKHGIVSPLSVQLLNRLAQLRPKTRYAPEPVQVSQDELKRLLENAQTMRNEIETRRPIRRKI